MAKISSMRGKLSIFISFVVLLVLLAACGNSNNNTNTGAQPTQANPTSGAVNSGTSDGCPNTAQVDTLTPQANVVTGQTNINSAVTAKNGDLIEVRLPFGQKWSGPTGSQGVLEMQQPSGFAWKADKVCIWRFVAKSTGTVELDFQARAICKAGETCPQYINTVPITIDVK
jgi:hypothetical protein